MTVRWNSADRVRRTGLGLGARCVLWVSVAMACVVGPQLARDAAALALLGRLTAQHALDALGARMLSDIEERSGTLSVDGTIIRTRRYLPRHARTRIPSVVLLHGVHPQGIEEAHLVAFARVLAASGLDVLTPELPELLSYRLEASTIGRIRALARAHARQSALPAVGVIGISFAGGLALMAAAEQPVRGAIAFVVSVGGHDDLLRLCRYYQGRDVRGPRGERVQVAAHPYGARVMIREHLEHFVSSRDLPLAQRALDAYLHDRAAQARSLALGLSESGRRVMSVLLDASQREAMAQLLDTAVRSVREQLVAASPHGHLASIRVPVFLIHGSDDPVIPSIETRYLAQEIPPRWLRQTVITPLLRHTEFPEPPKLAQTWELVRFLKGMLDAAGSAARPTASSGGATR